MGTTYKCPKCGADSTDADYCSDCGARITPQGAVKDAPVQGVGQTAAGTAGSEGEEFCPECLTPRTPGSRYCEVCRYDFQTKSSGVGTQQTEEPAPDAGRPVTQSVDQTVTGSAPAPMEDAPEKTLERLNVVIVVDPSVAAQTDLALPPGTKVPEGVPDRELPLDLDENLVGRRSNSKGIYPEIEIEDIGVSHRHLKFIKGPGGFTVLDLQSSNGTMLNGNFLTAGVAEPVK